MDIQHSAIIADYDAAWRGVAVGQGWRALEHVEVARATYNKREGHPSRVFQALAAATTNAYSPLFLLFSDGHFKNSMKKTILVLIHRRAKFL